MKRHKFNIYPEANPADFALLLEDIRANGYDPTFPITVYQGDIIDGCNRQKACEQLGVTPLYTEFPGNDEEALAFIMRTNNRRNLTQSQRSMVAAKWAGLKQGDIASQRSGPPIGEPQEPSTIATRAEAGKIFDVGTSSIDRAKKVMKEAPELVEKIEKGEMSVNAAYVTIKKNAEPEEEPETVVVDGTQENETPSRRPPLKIVESEGMRIWLLAKSHLDRINKHDEFREQALKACSDYCEKRISSNK